MCIVLNIICLQEDNEEGTLSVRQGPATLSSSVTNWLFLFQGNLEKINVSGGSI